MADLFFPQKRWYLYDTTTGTTVLKHPFDSTTPVRCPHCQKALVIENYKAHCCGYDYFTGWGAIQQRQPVCRHDRKSGRGWQSLRPYLKPGE